MFSIFKVPVIISAKSYVYFILQKKKLFFKAFHFLVQFYFNTKMKPFSQLKHAISGD
jgi:hypothetical protein